MYERHIKRPMDFCLALCAIIVLSPIIIILIICGAIAMRGNPFFTQMRPGKDEKIFRLIKFRTMDNRTYSNGTLLPDELRLNIYGKMIRATSLDELPELINILKGDMAVIGPRPQLVRDMLFMTPEQRKRHLVRPGLSGLAQANGRNSISWEEKFNYDLEYIENITFLGDVKLVLKTIKVALFCEDINAEESATAEDLGEYLLRKNVISEEVYNKTNEDYREKVTGGV